MKLFTFTTSAFIDELLVSMPGFSHRGQPFKIATTWYPFEEWKVKAHVYAKNRTHALKQLKRAGVHDIRDMNGGISANAPACIKL